MGRWLKCPSSVKWGLCCTDSYTANLTLVKAQWVNGLWFSKWGPHTCSVSVTQELTRNENSRAPLQTHWIRNSGHGASICVLTRRLGDSENHCFKGLIHGVPLPGSTLSLPSSKLYSLTLYLNFFTCTMGEIILCLPSRVIAGVKWISTCKALRSVSSR